MLRRRTERFEAIIEMIIEELREAVGRGDMKRVTYTPGAPRWFDRVLARLQNKGYQHVVVDGGR